MENIVDRIIVAMEKYPDKWVIKSDGYRDSNQYARLTVKGVSDVHVNYDGSVRLLSIGARQTTQAADLSVSYWERRKLKKAIAALYREKALRAVDRALLDTSENS